MKDYYKINEIARLYGIGVDSLRYYEKLGILKPRRDTNGYRLYNLKDMYKLNVIRDLRRLDFSMQQIKDYLEGQTVDHTLALLRQEQALVQAQAAYFRGCQAAPGPLLRREVAVQLGVHPSTVTRALRHKYLQCRQGLFPMEYFFARPMGAEGASPQRAKAALARMIQGEDPRRPLSDQALGERLQAAGMPLARRTVAKYRREMGLPPAYRRRR